MSGQREEGRDELRSAHPAGTVIQVAVVGGEPGTPRATDARYLLRLVGQPEGVAPIRVGPGHAYEHAAATDRGVTLYRRVAPGHVPVAASGWYLIPWHRVASLEFVGVTA